MVYMGVCGERAASVSMASDLSARERAPSLWVRCQSVQNVAAVRLQARAVGACGLHLAAGDGA